MNRIFRRLLLQGLRDLSLNPWVQLLTLVAVTLAAFLSGLFLMVLVTLDHHVGAVRGETAFQVYWRPGSDMGTVRRQWRSLQQAPGASRLRTYTPAEALQALGERLGRKDGSLAREFPHLADKSPLSPTALIAFAPAEEHFDRWFAETVAYLKNLPGVERVAATPLRDELGLAWRKVSRFVMWPAIGFLCMVLALVVGNAMRMSLLSRMQEIEILRLVGAFSWYIRTPLVVSGAVQGFAGGLIALALLQFMHAHIKNVLNFPPLLMEIRFLPWELALLLVAVPTIMGGLGSWVAIGEQ